MLSSISLNLVKSKNLLFVNPFLYTPFWDRPMFKEAADDNWNVATKRFQDTDCIENIVEKGEIAQNEQFHLFHNFFLKLFSSLC